MSDYSITMDLKKYLEALSQVVSISEVCIEHDIIKYIALEIKKVGKIIARQLDVDDGPRLFDFYFQGLSERSRRNFIPYPLFNTPPCSAEELSQRIADWQKEDDWSAIILENEDGILGLCILKRFHTEHVTSGIVIRDDWTGIGLGYLLQMIIIGQARLLNLKKFHVKIISDNQSSIRLHEKCGFRKVGFVPWDGFEGLRDFLSANDPPDADTNRQIIKMVIELDDTESK